jgi:hypothetical protein
LKTKPQRYHCPHCKWNFSFRKKRCCPGCGTFLLIGSDPCSDAELSRARAVWTNCRRLPNWSLANFRMGCDSCGNEEQQKAITLLLALERGFVTECLFFPVQCFAFDGSVW